jgi:hypothetical protein
MTKMMRKLRDQLKKTDKCPVCRTDFCAESLHPFDVAVREEFRLRRKRRRAALKGWRTRRNGLPRSDNH